MRIRLRTPTGATTVTLPETATWADLKRSISEATSIVTFDLKHGYPPAPLSSFDDDIPLLALGIPLDNSQLTVIPTTRASSPPPPDTDIPLIPVPQLSAALALRVMPDDNSCLFRALSTALLSADLDGATELRSLVAQRIQADPTTFTAAVLGKAPDAYCEWIQRPDSWGGGIEMAVLSQEFGVEIASVAVQDGRVDRFNEGVGRRVVVVYSGIHYDVVALTESGAVAEDRKVFDVGADGEDGGVLDAARELCGLLRERHYYTDTTGFDLKCNVCGWKGKGERGATEHATQTGHMDFGES